MPPRSTTPPGAESDRMVGDLVREGVIDTVDLDAGKVVVSFGDQKTPPIDWLMAVGDTTIWIPPTEGQQVCVLSPEGDVERAYVIGGLPSSAMAPLFLGLKNAIRFKDGAVASYDPEANELKLDLPGAMKIVVPNGLDIEGEVTVSKTLKAEIDVVGGGKSLKSHKHTGVSAGGSLSGAPQ